MQNRRKNRKQDTPDPRILTHIELETERVKDATEAVLYDLLPAAVAVATENDTEELNWKRCQQVAGAVLVAACLLNVPPSFLEFLLCLPWRQLEDLSLRPELDVTEAPQVTLDLDDRKLLANLALHPRLMDCVMDFLYRPYPGQVYQFQDSLPMQLRLVSDLPQANFEQVQVKLSTRSAVAALLDGATPLHAAALRGNPAQIDHLLFCKANPMARTAAGDCPLELVPPCEEQPAGVANPATACHCLGRREAEVWQCRSKLARGLIVRRCLTHFAAGFKAWLSIALLSLACLFGMWTPAPALHRPVLHSHETKRAYARRVELSALAGTLGEQVHSVAAQGKQHLANAKEDYTRDGQQSSRSDHSCNGSEAATNPWSDSRQTVSQYACCGSKRVLSRAVQNADSAFDCFSRALKALQDNLRIVQKFVDPCLGPFSSDLMSNIVSEEKQADIYCCWAEAALLKYKGCLCTGCRAMSTQAIRLSYFHTSRLFSIGEKKRTRVPSVYKLAGASLARVLHSHICLLLHSHAQYSVTHNVLLQAQLCLQEWDRMIALGLAASAELETSPDVAALHTWAQTASADLKLAEALMGSPLGPDEPLDANLPQAFAFDASGQAFIARRMDKEIALQLDAAVQAAEAASPSLLAIARQAATNAVEEVQSAAALQVITAGRLEGPLPTVEELTIAINAAALFPNLKEDVLFGQQLRDRWERRNETVQQLEKVMQDVCSPCNLSHAYEPSQADYQECSADWTLRIKELEHAIEQARETELSISMQKAKRILREMQTQAAAAEAAAILEAVLQHQSCKPAELRAELAGAEAANSAIASTLLSDTPDVLPPLIQRAKTQLHVLSITEALHEAAAAAHTTADLPRLDSAILAAQKAGLDGLLPEPCRRAQELRSTLNYTAEAKATLQAALDSLQHHGQPQDAAALEEAIRAGEAAGDVLEDDVAHAKQAVARWHAGVATEAKLNRALKDGTSAHMLGRAVQEANAIGLKVGDARKVLKLMQALEAALQQEEPLDALAARDLLKAKVEAAEQGGVPSSCIAPARPRLLKLLMQEVKQSLDAALKPKVGQPMAMRASNIRSVLDRAEGLINDGLPADSATFLESARQLQHRKQYAEIEDSLFSDQQVTLSAAAARRSLMEAYNFVAMEAEELRQLEAQRVAELIAKQEQQRLERAHQEKMAKAKAERERTDSLERERQKRIQKERAEAELKQQMFRVTRSDEELPTRQEGASSPWRHLQPRPQESRPPSSPQLAALQLPLPQLPLSQLPLSQLPLSQLPSPQLPPPQMPLPQMLPQQTPPPLHSPHSHLQHPPLQQQLHTDLQEPGPQLHAPVLQEGQQTPLQQDRGLCSSFPAAKSDQARRNDHNSNVSASHWLQTDDSKASIQSPRMQQHQQRGLQDQPAWEGQFWRLDVSHTSNGIDDTYDGSASERQSEAASSSIHRPAGRMPIRSTSLRSSAASSDGLCSPRNPGRSCTGASSMHSYFVGKSSADAYDGRASSLEAGPLGSSHSLFSNQEYGLGLDAQRQTLSPEAGTERSGSSFSSGVTGRLTYADLGGAAWGAPADAKVGATFTPAATSFQAPPLSAFGPIGSRRAGDGKEISRLWAPESPSADHAVHTPKQARHRREVSLSDMGHLGFVPRDDHSGSLGSLQDQAMPLHFQAAQHSADGPQAVRTLKVQRQCRFFMTGFCKWGDTCKFSHDKPNGAFASGVPATSATGVVSRPMSVHSGLPSHALHTSNANAASPDCHPHTGSIFGGSNSMFRQPNGAQSLAVSSQHEPLLPPFEFKPSHPMTSGMQPVFTTPNTAPVAPLGAVGNIWSATDIANSSPFPGVGLGLPKKFVS